MLFLQIDLTETVFVFLAFSFFTPFLTASTCELECVCMCIGFMYVSGKAELLAVKLLGVSNKYA